MKVLIPILSKKENDEKFIDAAVIGAKEITLLVVVDTSLTSGGYGFASSEISQGNALMNDIRAMVGKKKKTCDDVLEWGETITKIDHIARLREVDKVVLQKQDNKFYSDLIETLKKNQVRVEEIG